MTRPELELFLSRLTFRGWRFEIVKWISASRERARHRASGEGWLIQGTFRARCSISGRCEVQKTRKWYISPHMGYSEVAATVLKLVLTAVEHEVRESFLLDGVPIFGPHHSLRALKALAADTEIRN